jgi:catalase-peroxidase
MLASERHDKDGKLEKPLGAAHMGLIYVNPEGPQGKPDPVGSAKSVRVTFGRMAMNDEETVALVAGGHTFGKMHGARKKSCVGPEPGAATIEEQGLGWKNSCGKGHSEDTVTSGLEGAWTQAPTQWTTLYLQNLLNFEWQQIRSPAGALQWIPTDESLHSVVPDAHVKGKFNPPVMTTADLALKYDPAYRKIAERFLADPKEYQLAFAKAWFKLTHRDMGPRIRYLGSDVPSEVMIWQDPLPQASSKPVNARQIKQLKRAIAATDLSVADLVGTAWASASSFRGSDMRGGANGARLSLAPQKDWAVNQPQKLARVLNVLKAVQSEFNANSRRGVEVSLADVIVLGGAVGLERAAKEAGTEVSVPFTPGRVDALQEQTDVVSFAVLEPTADAFRNYFNVNQAYRSPAEMMVDKADQLRLTVPEMTVLLGGMRVLNANTDGSAHGVLTERPGTLSNDFFLNLLNGAHPWRKAATEGTYEQVDSATQEVKFTATSVDLIFGSNSELRAIAEAYAFDDAAPRFVKDFVSAWAKVMQLDRFDLENN